MTFLPLDCGGSTPQSTANLGSPPSPTGPRSGQQGGVEPPHSKGQAGTPASDSTLRV